MEFLKRIKFIDIVISTFFSTILTSLIYNKLFKIYTYSNLNDFLVGVSIYDDHNKFLDVFIYFLYLLIFFIFVYLFGFIGKKKEISEKNSLPNKKIEEKILFLRNILIKIQYIGLIGFIFLHPFNHHIYPKVIIIVLTLIMLGIADIIRCQKKSEFSPFAIAGILFIFFFCSYNIKYLPIDNFHFGETFATFFMHNNFGLKYYKDIMLVHGYIDVIPSWAGNFIFNTNSIYGYLLGEMLYRNLSFIFLLVAGGYIFNSALYLIIPFVFINTTYPAALFFISYLILIKLLDKRYCIILYTIFAFMFCLIWTTIGGFWLIASLPLLFYLLCKFDKRNIILSLLILALLILIFREQLLYYFIEAKYYTSSYLYAFGNNFNTVNYNNILPVFTRVFSLIFTPLLIIQLIKELKEKEKNIKNILFLSFFVICTLVSLSYTMGRIDGIWFLRLSYISIPYLCIVLPYYILNYCPEYYKKIIKILLNITLIFLCCINLFDIKDKVSYVEISQDEENKQRIADIQSYLDKYTTDITFFDLTNQGMNYLYLNKKIPVKYVSFYNSITTKQAENSLEKLKKNPPDIVLINSNNVIHDKIFPSVRVNPIYRWLLLCGKYKYEVYKNNGFLVKTENAGFKKEDISEFDYLFSNNNLKYLPSVWAKSLKTLPIIKTDIKFSYYINKNKLVINFDTPQNGHDVDFLYVFNNIKHPSKYFIYVNNSDSVLECYSANGKLLIPIDNFPSWLLNDEIKTITVEAIGFSEPHIEFYNKKKRVI